MGAFFLQGYCQGQQRFFYGAYGGSVENRIGAITVSWDDYAGYVAGLWVDRAAPYSVAYRLLQAAAALLTTQKVGGVIIQVTEENRVRKMYKRLGFVETNIPGIMTARMGDINRHLLRCSILHAHKVKG